MPRFIVLALALGVASSFSLSSAWAESMLSAGEIKTLHDKAENDDLKAQSELAKRYFKGDGVEQDHNQAAHWYKKLAEKEVMDAQLT